MKLAGKAPYRVLLANAVRTLSTGEAASTGQHWHIPPVGTRLPRRIAEACTVQVLRHSQLTVLVSVREDRAGAMDMGERCHPHYPRTRVPGEACTRAAELSRYIEMG